MSTGQQCLGRGWENQEPRKKGPQGISSVEGGRCPACRNGTVSPIPNYLIFKLKLIGFSYSEFILNMCWSKLSLAPLLLLNLTGLAGGQQEMQKGQRIGRQTESWGQVCWVLGWRRTTDSLLLFSIFFLIYFASLLYFYSLRPYSFTIL
jgi:hypothetical protein